MNLHYSYTKLNWDGFGGPMIVCHLVPNWFEKWILMRKVKDKRYVKAKTYDFMKDAHIKRWCELECDRHVKPLHRFWKYALIERLEEIYHGDHTIICI
jgi:hypothetical protein